MGNVVRCEHLMLNFDSRLDRPKNVLVEAILVILSKIVMVPSIPHPLAPLFDLPSHFSTMHSDPDGTSHYLR